MTTNAPWLDWYQPLNRSFMKLRMLYAYRCMVGWSVFAERNWFCKVCCLRSSAIDHKIRITRCFEKVNRFKFWKYEGNFRSNVNVIILAYSMYTTGNVSFWAYEQNLFWWCTIHACLSARANVSTVSRHWKYLYSGCNPYPLIAPKSV